MRIHFAPLFSGRGSNQRMETDSAALRDSSAVLSFNDFYKMATGSTPSQRLLAAII
jgi:hypothetical protein